MSKYAKSFILRTGFETAAFDFLVMLFLYMLFPSVTIERDKNIMPFTVLLPLLSFTAMAAFYLIIAKHNTNVLRRAELSMQPGRELKLYGVFAVLMILITLTAAIYTYRRAAGFFDSALSYAIKDAQIKNETPSFRKAVIAELRAKYDGYILAAKITAAVCSVVCAFIYFRSAAILVLTYRNPPDFWTGKKRR